MLTSLHPCDVAFNSSLYVKKWRLAILASEVLSSKLPRTQPSHPPKMRGFNGNFAKNRQYLWHFANYSPSKLTTCLIIRVEPVPQPFTEQVASEDHNQDGDTGESRQPPLIEL